MVEIVGGNKAGTALAKIERNLSTTGGVPTVKVGFLAGATYPDGTSVPLVAAINEFGAPSRGQPPRPFMRNTIAAHAEEWPRDLAKILKANGGDGEAALALMGDRIKGQIRRSINDLMEPALADSTVARKGFEKPLVDTSHMWNSVDFVVEE